MLRKTIQQLAIAIFLLSAISATAQHQFLGYRSGNYTGVNGVFFNPANIVDSRYRWDVNLIGINAGIGNNNATFKLKNIGDGFGDNADSLLFGNTDKKTNGLVNTDIFGPSFMFNAGKKVSFAFSTRVRAMANISDIDGKFVQSIDNATSGTYPFNFNSDANQKLIVNGWTDFSASMGMILSDKGKHFLKGGVTLKYLAGAANSFANLNKLKGTLNQDITGNDYFTNTSGTISVGYSGFDLDNFEASDAFKFNGNGFGADLGFVYEYRPDGDKTERYQNKYKIKAGLAILDIGSIKYKPRTNEYGSYTVAISGAETWYPSELDGKSVSEIKTYLDSKPTLFTNNTAALSSYKAKLPTTLQANVDWAINRGFFVDLAGQLSFKNKQDIYSPFYSNNITLTPRYEGRAFGIYLPINYNQITNFNAGISLRAGPFFLGSGSVITALLDKSKQADIHFGIRFGSLQKKKKKVKEEVVVAEEIKTVAPVVVVADTDGDGINDNDDKCPTIAGLAKYNGCPIPDTDKDGINDEEDKCVTVAGVARYQGCPIPDTDKDGINDEEDKCPTVAGVARYEGCPVPDTDKDGINDEEDRCPNLAGVAANNGCPEVKQEVVKKINFAAKNILFQTGKAILLNPSYKQLDQVAAILKEDAGLKLNIEGHTDNVGKPEMNQALSQKRADAVKAYLLKKAVTEDRLTATGFGDTMPVADNKTVAGKAKNRRVELKLSY